MSKDYKDFLNMNEPNAPDHLSAKIIKKSQRTIQPSDLHVLLKYSLLFCASAILSLLFCPQYGIGFFEKNYPLFFHYLHSNNILCGVYCGLLFVVFTHGLSLLSCTYFERQFFLKKYTFLPFLLMGGAYAIFMSIGRGSYSWDIKYQMSWIIIVIVGLIFFNSFFKRIKFI